MKQLEENLSKFLQGNKTAGTRARQNLQDLKTVSQDIRICIQDIKNKQKEK